MNKGSIVFVAVEACSFSWEEVWQHLAHFSHHRVTVGVVKGSGIGQI